MSADLHFFPFYAKDWLTGQGTVLMTPEQKGAFIDLLAHAWMSEPPCTVPDDDAALIKLSGLSRARWAAIGGVLRAQFEPVDGGRLRNPKLYGIWLEQQAKHEKRVRAGATGGKAKAMLQQSSSNARAMLEQCSTNQNQNQNQKEKSPPTPRASRVAADAAVVADTDRVLAHYTTRHPKRRPGEKERRLVTKHLARWSAVELCEAIDGNADDAWHRERGKHELAYVLRDDDKIGEFRDRALPAIDPNFQLPEDADPHAIIAAATGGRAA